MTLIYRKRSKDQLLGQAASNHLGISKNGVNRNSEVEQTACSKPRAVRESLRTHENIKGATSYKTRKRKNAKEPKHSKHKPMPTSANIEYNISDKTPTAHYLSLIHI